MKSFCGEATIAAAPGVARLRDRAANALGGIVSDTAPSKAIHTPAVESRPARDGGYFEARRNDVALWLFEHYPNAFRLAYIIAYRARWHTDGFNPHELQFGEAFLGDHDRYGRMTEGDYRGAKRVLTRMHLATFKRTNRGTVARLVDSRLFKINPSKAHGQGNGQPTGEVTTNLNLKAIEHESQKAFSTKASKLNARQKELADRIEAALGNQWTNDAGKWIGRIKSKPGKCERVIAEVESAAREERIKTTPAQYAEQIWKEFAP